MKELSRKISLSQAELALSQLRAKIAWAILSALLLLLFAVVYNLNSEPSDAWEFFKGAWYFICIVQVALTVTIVRRFRSIVQTINAYQGEI